MFVPLFSMFVPLFFLPLSFVNSLLRSFVPALELDRLPGSTITIKIPNLPIGKPDTPSWQRFLALCQTQEQNTVLRLPGVDVLYHPSQVTREILEAQHPTVINAILAQRCGTISSHPCYNCADSLNAFPTCRAIHNHFGGSCGNCIWRNDAQSCCRSYPSVPLSRLAAVASVRQPVLVDNPSAFSGRLPLINSASAPPSQPTSPSSASSLWRALVLNPSPSPSAASPLLPSSIKSPLTLKRLSESSSPLKPYNDDDQEHPVLFVPSTPILSRKRPREASSPLSRIIASIEEPVSPDFRRPRSRLRPAPPFGNNIQILPGPSPDFPSPNRSFVHTPSLDIDGSEEAFVTPAPRRSPRRH